MRRRIVIGIITGVLALSGAAPTTSSTANAAANRDDVASRAPPAPPAMLVPLRVRAPTDAPTPERRHLLAARRQHLDLLVDQLRALDGLPGPTGPADGP